MESLPDSVGEYTFMTRKLNPYIFILIAKILGSRISGSSYEIPASARIRIPTPASLRLFIPHHIYSYCSPLSRQISFLPLFLYFVSCKQQKLRPAFETSFVIQTENSNNSSLYSEIGPACHMGKHSQLQL